ncbi:phosphotransferase [Mycetocola sp.]|uniref:phosphotransferase n=1 Tax=Mycetocola sp. TaxID=1871042 RepID=UPI002602A327|nr:phosphotransferase [Mycetocola sp.]
MPSHPGMGGHPVRIHTDLLRPNLLTHHGELAAVIDWGGAGIGDPAADVTADTVMLRTAVGAPHHPFG